MQQIAGDVLTADRASRTPSADLLLQFLAWVSARPRTYADTMDAWRTSCPRLSVWEDATTQSLVRLETSAAARQRDARVVLTEAGRKALRAL